MPSYSAYASKNDIFSSIALPISILAVALRFVARARSNQQYGFEDWFSVLSLLFFIPYCPLLIACGHHGAGYVPPKIPYRLLVKALKITWAAEKLVPAGMMCAKKSILFFYIRIFAVNRTFAISVCQIHWSTECLVVHRSYHQPYSPMPTVEKAWDPILPGHCFRFPPFMVGIEVPNSLLDFVIMALPINMLRSLRITRKEKVVLGFIFVMGEVVGLRFVMNAKWLHGFNMRALENYA